MPIPTAKTGPSANRAPFAAPAARTAKHANRRHPYEPDEAGTHASRLGRRIDAGHRHRHDGQREQRAGNGEGGKAARSKGLKRQLPAR